MQTVALYIDVSSDSLLAGLNTASKIQAQSLPLFFGDTVQLKVYLLDRTANAALNATNPYLPITLTGLQLQLFIDDGHVTNPTIYAQQSAFTVDSTNPNQQFFTASLSLNTPALQTLLGTAGPEGTVAWLKIGYFQGGFQTTVFSQRVNIGVGIPSSAPQPPPGQTVLTAEVAANTYIPLQPVNGQPIFIASALGKKIVLWVEDMPDGSQKFHADPA